MALIGSNMVSKAAQDSGYCCWDQHISSIWYIILYDSSDVFRLSCNWLSSPIRTCCPRQWIEDTTTMHHTQSSASLHHIVPWFQISIAYNWYCKFCIKNRWWCTVDHNILPAALASPVLILLLPQKVYSSLAEQCHCWHTQLLFCGVRSPWIKILSN